jgi:hypothetical protein
LLEANVAAGINQKHLLEANIAAGIDQKQLLEANVAAGIGKMDFLAHCRSNRENRVVNPAASSDNAVDNGQKAPIFVENALTRRPSPGNRVRDAGPQCGKRGGGIV